ncbi:hypothetical protein [Bifidobacterium castoris]|uniref:MerR family transcriptional regulator n=1 Tax=Bifidobacterium castoris TaxID=2306972 RepID=A0A430F4G1_9BIFI|nr:hypothetical protein [Bifidobacterium castoris]RSX44653.1 hypothetical protein D2E22_1939 [Bifidobacterium castoris]
MGDPLYFVDHDGDPYVSVASLLRFLDRKIEALDVTLKSMRESNAIDGVSLLTGMRLEVVGIRAQIDDMVTLRDDRIEQLEDD